MAGAGTVIGGASLSIAGTKGAQAVSLDPALAEFVRSQCGVELNGAGKIPFICFDLAGGASTAGSNVLVGGEGGQLDFLSTAGYELQGLPGDMVPPVANPDGQSGDFVDQQLGLAFHSDSAYLRGILEKVSNPATRANINGAVIPARSENDTGNNPHNPVYGIARAGASGSLLDLIGSEPTDSGGASLAPMQFMDLSQRPTKVDRPSDVTGLVDTGDLTEVLTQEDAVIVMESIYRISEQRLADIDVHDRNAPVAPITSADVIRQMVECEYLRSADIADRFGSPSALDPGNDPDIVGPNGVFSQAEYDNDSEFRKTASVMKMVINGFAGAGTIELGGYDYHGGRRAEGEVKDLRAGRCMGACLDYAARTGTPLMMYVFSDGSVSSDGAIDNSVDGRGKGEWTTDNQQTAATWFLVYNPNGQASLLGGTPEEQARHQQLGYMRPEGAVETAATPAANNVNLLAQTVYLNYMALHGEQGQFDQVFTGHGLGDATLQDSLTAFAPIVNGTISN